MRRLASLVAVVLLLITAVPALACITAAEMSSSESACCRAMHGHCRGMEKMRCCAPTLHSEHTPQIPPREPVTTSQQPAVLESIPAAFPVLAPTRVLLRRPEGYLPPGLLTARSTVLRI